MERYNLIVGDSVVECVVRDKELWHDGVNYAVLLSADGSDLIYYCIHDPEYGTYTLIENDILWCSVEDSYEQIFANRLDTERYGDGLVEEEIVDESSYYTVVVNGKETECDITRLFEGPKRRTYALVEPIDKASAGWTFEFFGYKTGLLGIFGKPKLIPIKDDKEYYAVKECYDRLENE